MLPKSRRIPRELFGEILKSRRFAHSPHFSLRFVPGDGVRAAVSVSKKVSKSAVARNTIRRRAYYALRPRLDLLPKGLYLFVAKAGADKVKGQKLSQELEILSSKI